MRINTSGMDPKIAAAFRDIELALTKLEQSGSATPLAPDMMELPTERETDPGGASIVWNENNATIEVYHPGKKQWVTISTEG